MSVTRALIICPISHALLPVGPNWAKLRFMRLLPLLLGLYLGLTPVLTTPANAATEPQPQRAIAMHGTPKYADGFSQLDYVNPNAPKGGTLRLAATGSFDNLNAYSVRGTKPANIDLVSQSLLGRSWDEAWSLYALLAESFRIADDRSWIEFTLNPAARWSDGTALTTDDVLFSWQSLKDKGRPNHRLYYSKVKRASSPAPSVVRFDFITEPVIDRELPMIMGMMPILQKKWWSGRDLTAPTLDIPPSIAPYQIGSIIAGRKIVYERVANYWGKNLPFNRGQWNFDQISIDYYRDDNIALEAFKSGAYDLRREQDPQTWQTAYKGPGLNSGQYKQLEIAHGRPEPFRGFVFNLRREPFNHSAVREAISMIFDFEWANQTLYAGRYQRTDSLFSNSELAAKALIAAPMPTGLTPEQKAGLQRQRYRKALELLHSASYNLTNGVLSKHDVPLTFEILLNDSRDEKIALAFIHTLKRLGITATVRTVDSAQFQARLSEFDYDMTVTFWLSTLSPGNEQFNYWGSKAAQKPGSRNYTGLQDKAVDAAISDMVTAKSRAALVTAAQRLDQLVLGQHTVIPFGYLGNDMIAVNSKLQRPNTNPIYGATPEQSWWWQPN
jgi:microcin C transport system substrate-binding protein